ncbi:MAG: AraC family transcriptional regulator [Polyangiaceae bacterium]|nr:AraC family transcriptional regulator [Polyangiaceae bacterium]
MIVFEERLSDSPFVERVWRSHSERAGTFRSIAASTFEMVVSRHGGRTSFTLRGPETRATLADLPPHGEWLGIRFKVGSFVPHLTPGSLADRRDVTLPDATARSFWLNGSAWEYPDFENAESFVAKLVRKAILVRDPVVAAALDGRPSALSSRTVERRFLQATGLPYGAIRQIERARHATVLLREGLPIADAANAAGYYDQAHMTRSLRRRIGQTPGEIVRGREQLSFLYKTTTTQPPIPRS